jgi:hypothetical protein
VEYVIHPHLIAIMKEKSFVGDDPDEDPYSILHLFTEFCWRIKLRYYSDDELKLKLFSQSLTNTALSWYRTCHAEKIDTWENLMKEFIFRFYPKVKSAKVRRCITNFENRRDESLMIAYLRYKGMIESCPHHDFMEDLIKIIKES